MKVVSLIILLVLISPITKASELCSHKQLRVAVIDSGLDLKDPQFTKHLCPTGHKNFVLNESIKDYNSHGSHVTGLIQQYAGTANYCLLIYKYYSDLSTGEQNLAREVLSLKEAILNNADIVNFSGGGSTFDEQEYLLIKNNPKITFVVAAGNDGKDLDIPGNEYYPAQYWLPNETVVMAVNKNGIRLPFSNWSIKTTVSELGEYVFSNMPNGKMGYKSGTSQATAIFTGKLVDKLSRTCKYK